MTTATEARAKRGPDPIPADVRALLQAGKLEQTCPDCGRTEAAHRYCSWCFRRMAPGDWYRNRDRTERDRRMPSAAPTNPPTEFRQTYRPDKADGWPPTWGPNPHSKAAQTAGKPVNRPLDADGGVPAPVSGAAPDDGTLFGLVGDRS